MNRLKLNQETAYLLAAALPIGWLAIVFAADAWRQVATAAKIEQRVEMIKADGLATNNLDEMNASDAVLQRDETGDFSSFYLASLRHSTWWDRDVRDIDEVVPSDQPWDAAPYIDWRTDEEKIVLDLVPDFNQTNARMWTPSLHVYASSWGGAYRSYSLYENAHRVFQKAFHDGDFELALDWYRRIGDSDLLRKSLKSKAWNAEQLAALREIESKPIDSDKRWTDQINQALSRACIRLGLEVPAPPRERWNRDTTSLSPLGVLPSHALSSIKYLDAASRLRPAGTLAHVVRASELDSELRFGASEQSFSTLGIPFALKEDAIEGRDFYLQNTAERLTQSVFDQKWTVAAIAVRQYEWQEGKLPEKIEDLRVVGLKESDWRLSRDFSLRLEKQRGDAIVLSCLQVSKYMTLRQMNRLSTIGLQAGELNGWTPLEMR